MKKKQKQKIEKKLPSFIQKLTVALVIYGCSFFFTKVKFYSEILKIIAVFILLGKELIEIIKQIRKEEKDTNNTIIILVIFVFLFLRKFDAANISAILFYIKKDILKEKRLEEEKEQIKNLKLAKKGELVILPKGKRIYFDGVLKMPKAYFLNQDGKRVVVKKEEKVSSGWINLTAKTKIEVEKPYQETEYYHLKTKKDKMIATTSKKDAKMIKVFTIYQRLVVIGMGIYILLSFILQLDIENTIYTASLFLTLIYTINPTNLLKNISNNVIGTLFDERIVVENKNDLWKVVNLKNYIFEKTKTLTVGNFRITEVETEDENQLFYYLNYGEYFSNHPIKEAVLKYKAYEVNPEKIKAYKSYPNKGIYYKIENKEVRIGSLRFMTENDIDVEINYGIGTIIYVAVDKEYIGSIVISDGIKYKTKMAIENLKKTKPKHLAILSSDNERITTAIAKELRIKDHYSNLTEKEKIFWLRHLKEKYPYQTALIGSIDTKEDLLKEADFSIILTNYVENKKEASIFLLDNDLSKISLLNQLMKDFQKKEIIYKTTTIFIILLLDILLILNYLPLWFIIITSWVLEILENKTRKEG